MRRDAFDRLTPLPSPALRSPDLEWPEAKMHAAVAYAKAFPDEIEGAIRDNASIDFEKLSRLLPGIQRFDDITAKGKK